MFQLLMDFKRVKTQTENPPLVARLVDFHTSYIVEGDLQRTSACEKRRLLTHNELARIFANIFDFAVKMMGIKARIVVKRRIFKSRMIR